MDEAFSYQCGYVERMSEAGHSPSRLKGAVLNLEPLVVIVVVVVANSQIPGFSYYNPMSKTIGHITNSAGQCWDVSTYLSIWCQTSHQWVIPLHRDRNCPL